MRKFLLRLVDDKSKTSLSSRFRSKRFALFRELLNTLPKPVKILDVGGRPYLWEREGFFNDPAYCSITIINVEQLEIDATNVIASTGDARHMHQFKDNEFDIVFSNSVIEHVGDYEDQQKMACEVKRVGKQYFIQTPNKFFFIEPHFMFPLFQFFPVWLKVALIRSFSLGNRGKASTTEEAKKRMNIKLLSKGELMELFPGSKLFEEKVMGFVKSFVVYR